MDDDEKQQSDGAYALLGGFTEYDERGVPRHKYYAAGSNEEDQCRLSLARYLRSGAPLDAQIREMLAQLFEPVSDPQTTIWGNRKLVFKERKGCGRRRDHGANTHIAWFVWERVRKGEGTEKAIIAAMDKFKLSRERVYDIWGPYKKIFEIVWGRLGSV